MTKLTIAPLSIPGSITTASQSAIEHAGSLFLQTADSPCARWITDAGLPYVSMDDLYDSSYDYDELNQAIAARLMCGCDAVYAVSGRGIGEGQLSAIREAASKAGATVKVLPGIGYSDAVLADLPFTLSDRRVICAANDLPDTIDPFLPLCVEEMDTRLCAAMLRRCLIITPMSTPCTSAIWGQTANTALREIISFFELDRQNSYSAATCCIVPPAASQDKLDRGDMNGLMAVLRRPQPRAAAPGTQSRPTNPCAPALSRRPMR